jgi:hypothetical protein
MDPSANLREQLHLAVSITKANEGEDGGSIDVVDACRLAELVLALDQWVCRGGFLPQRWQIERAKRERGS